jgi:hypothetical protein
MRKGGAVWDGREQLAEFLFDGDKEKAERLLILIDSFTNPILPPEFKKLVMNLPEENCKWCTRDGECLFYMPDSMFLCKKKCENFIEKESN